MSAILSPETVPFSLTIYTCGSQYSNGHKGFIIEFKDGFWQHPSMKSKEGDEYTVRKVAYVDDYSINLDEIADESGNITVASIHDELFYKKTSRWEHENEYRMVRPLTDSPYYTAPNLRHIFTDLRVYLFPFDTDCISSIVFGANMSVENKRLISQYCQSRNIPYLQSFLFRDYIDRFGKPTSIHILPITSSRERQAVLNSKPQLFCTDTISHGHQTTTKIADIKELPYYDVYPEIVDELYADLLENK